MEISAYSLLWFPSDERNCLMVVLCVSLAQAPDIFCRISDFYYFKLNVSSQKLLLWRWALHHWDACDLHVDICESCTPGNTAVIGTTSESEIRRVSFQKCGKETWCHCWQKDSKNNNLAAFFFFFPVNSINGIWYSLREELNGRHYSILRLISCFQFCNP